MIPLAGQAVLTAAEMRAAEAATGADSWTLMCRAGDAVAAAVHRLAAPGEVLVLCGPGNNGGDGYLAAAGLRARGVPVRVAALAEPGTETARRAWARWTGPVEPLEEAAPAPVLLDALFGTGLTRPLDGETAAALSRVAAAATLRVALDLPSGVDTDNGDCPGEVPRFDVTLALGAAKPAHLLQPAAARCGAVRLLPIGLADAPRTTVLATPTLPSPGPHSHKFNRGMVAVVRGRMAGASHLAARAAMRAGAGYVELLGASIPGAPHALVRRPLDAKALADTRIGALVVGPGLGRDDMARDTLAQALATEHRLVVDGDALHLLDLDPLSRREACTILTPHAGEFDALFGSGEGSKIDRTRAAAARSGAVVVFKGADTVIAQPDGTVRIAERANDWLSTAGTGDVLAGAIGAALAGGVPPLDAAGAGVWLHGEAARRLGAAFIADDLADALSAARAAL